MAAKKKAVAKAAPKAPAAKTKAKAPAKAKAKTAARKAPARKPVAPPPERRARMRSLVVVESPAKARTIKKYLGAGYTVKASVGHIKDLPKSKIGVDVEHDFEPEYVPIRKKEKVIAEIQHAAETADTVYLAPDPDREGEAIAWHIAEEIKPHVRGKIYRVLFNEITKKGITAALAEPTDLNLPKYEAQQARRILDRLVGYQISPLLWNKVRRGLSAGRVQSVAVRLVCEREAEIKAFNPEEYWSIECDLEAGGPPPFTAKVFKVDGEKADLPDGDTARAIALQLQDSRYTVEKVERKERRKFPQPPFITSKLQQEAARKLRFTAKKTMALAQRLYEGLELGDEGPVGLITYMRTDSVRLADDAVNEVRGYIGQRFGGDFLPDEAVVYKVSSKAQGAHEAIRPTSMQYDPETVRRLLMATGKMVEDPRDLEDHVALYTLIWNRFVACQMKPAVFDSTTVDIDATAASGAGARKVTLRATGQIIKFAGYTQIYTESAEEDASRQKKEAEPEAPEETGDRVLPPMSEGDALTLVQVKPEQHFTQPPPRFSEASLVKELEEKGIGRPSTFASILSTIQDRGYVEKREGRFHPTELGGLVNGLLVESFPDIVDVGFTAGMESGLDKVEEGETDWHKLLHDFYGPFKADLAKAEVEMRDVKREETPTDFRCEKCGSPMVIKWGRNGSFLACKAYPECKSTKEFVRRGDGTIEIVPEKTTNEKCPTCTADMKVKRGRFGEFLACSRYPDCKTTMPISLGVACPRPNCGGYITQKRSKRGKPFYGCSNYSKTQCDFVLWDRPVPEKCPRCEAPFVVKRETKRGSTLRCVQEGCGWLSSGAAEEEESDVSGPSGAVDAPN
jgi:DNA topoisomerase-1